MESDIRKDEWDQEDCNVDQIAMVVLGLISLAAAIYAMYAKRVLSAVIASGVISLMASIMFLIAAAPDVAMTEATIGQA